MLLPAELDEYRELLQLRFISPWWAFSPHWRFWSNVSGNAEIAWKGSPDGNTAACTKVWTTTSAVDTGPRTAAECAQLIKAALDL